MTSSRLSSFARTAAIAAVALAATPALADEPDLKITVKEVAVDGSDVPKLVVTAVIPQAPKKVWAVVSDCANYKTRMPRVAASELVKKEGNVHTCKVTISMPFPLSNLTATTAAVHEESERRMKRTWKMVESNDYEFNNGSWEVEAADDAGTTSKVTYSVHVKPKTIVPAGLRKSAQKGALPDMMTRVAAEAAKMP
jgi:ribosome-associated toxin RatA of RatAB toxin-antitoxin module